MNFTAIDFETANYQPNSACSLALIVVRDNHIVNQFYTLINPEHHFEARNTAIHHITASMVVDAPKFPTIWPHIAPLFTAKQLIVAHNLPFDKRVLMTMLAAYDLLPVHFLGLDTVRSSRKLYPELPNHKLNTVSDFLNLNLTNHHNALADSIACAQILLHQHQEFGENQLKPFIKSY